jgi:hypothetical protein
MVGSRGRPGNRNYIGNTYALTLVSPPVGFWKEFLGAYDWWIFNQTSAPMYDLF